MTATIWLFSVTLVNLADALVNCANLTWTLKVSWGCGGEALEFRTLEKRARLAL